MFVCAVDSVAPPESCVEVEAIADLNFFLGFICLEALVSKGIVSKGTFSALRGEVVIDDGGSERLHSSFETHLREDI